MEITEIFNLIANNGFAIFVAVYMLVYFNKTINGISEAVRELGSSIKSLGTLINTLHGRDVDAE